MYASLTHTRKEIITMKVYIGIDVHLKSFSLCSYTIEDDRAFAHTKISSSADDIESYVATIRQLKGAGSEIICGYEAGCFGYTLQKLLSDRGIRCVILAPSTMPRPVKEIKTDKRDSEKIARCLAYHTYQEVFVPDDEDIAVKDYLRMREDHKEDFKRIKQRILSFLLRHGKHFDEAGYWTKRHIRWLRELPLPEKEREILDEYLISYDCYRIRLENMDKRIEEIALEERYREKVKRLICLRGVRTITALASICETGDFFRFGSAQSYSSFLGLVPGEHSSGDRRRQEGITKTGNKYLRRLMIEAAKTYGRGVLVSKKSKEVMERQRGASPEVIAYADRAADRLRKKYWRILAKSDHNTATVAIARELSCFVWGMMTDHIR